MAIIDIVIARRENDEIQGARDFLTMLSQQRYANFNDITVTFIQMGNDRNGMDELRHASENMPFSVRVVGTEYTQLAKIYNLAIEHSSAEWILFSGWGDMFSDVYALKMILALLPTDQFDVLWMEYYTEFATTQSNGYINVTGEADSTVNGKLFRRQFLMSTGIRFDESLKYYIGAVFINLAISKLEIDRFAKIKTKFVPYTHFDGAADEQSEFEQIEYMHRTNMAIIDNIKRYGGSKDKYIEAVVDAICCGFYYAHFEKAYPGMAKINAEIGKLYRDHRSIIDAIKPQDLEVFLYEAQTKTLNLIQEAYRKYGYEMYFDVENVSFREWIRQFIVDSPF